MDTWVSFLIDENETFVGENGPLEKRRIASADQKIF